MDIYTEIGEENFVILFKVIFKDYMNEYYGINAKYKIDDIVFYNTDDLINYVSKHYDYLIDEVINDLGFVYIYRVIKHFIDKCPFDIIYRI